MVNSLSISLKGLLYQIEKHLCQLIIIKPSNCFQIFKYLNENKIELFDGICLKPYIYMISGSSRTSFFYIFRQYLVDDKQEVT